MNIAERYDSLPYPTKFFAQTNPGRLAAFGTLLDIEVTDPRKCRVLEFGCGDGSNLISHAFSLPNSQFVGIDISGEHIKTATTWADEIGLSNVEFRKADVMEMTEAEYGKFDYLVAHGLITWIPEAVIEKVFELFGSLISENGIGYVSYNTYPGAHLRDMVREMMVYHTRDITEPLEKVDAASSFLKILAENTSDQTAYKQVLMAERIRHTKHSAGDFFHDDLSEFYFPFRFSEIARKLDANGLQYLCESEFQSMSRRNLSPGIQELIKDITDLSELEDYMDFARGRQFRKTLFCKKARAISRDLKPEKLSGLALASTAKPESKENLAKESKPVRFVSQLGAGIEIDHPVTKLALTEIGSKDGAPIQFEDILASVKSEVDVSDWDHEEDICRRILIRLIEDTAMIELYSFSEPEPGITSDRPMVSRLAKWQLRVGASITSRHGAVIGLDDDVAKRLCELADGTRTVSQIETGIREFVTKEAIEKEVRSDLGEWVRESIHTLSKTGIFVADEE